jgi:preprotein translocase subunit SecD
MRHALRVAATIALLAACRGAVHDPRVGTIELVFDPIQRGWAPDAALVLDHARDLVARRLAVLRIPVEVARVGDRLVVMIPGDAEPGLVSRVKAAVLTQGRVEVRELAGDALGPVLVDNGAVRDALSVSAGDAPAIRLRLERDAAVRFEAATRRLVGSRLVVTLDERLIAAPLVEAPISDGRIQIILGKYGTHELASTIALVLEAGEPLPFPLRLFAERRLPPRAD